MTATIGFRRDFFAAPIVSPPLTDAIDRAARCILNRQLPDGQWPGANPIEATTQALFALAAADGPAAAVRRAWDWLWPRVVQNDGPAPSELDAFATLEALCRSSIADTDAGLRVIADAVAALRDLQNDDGGWGLSATPGTNAPVLSCPEVTGRVLAVLGATGAAAGDDAVEPAIDYLEHEQEADSGWAGSLAATWRALAGLRAVGVDSRFAAVRRAAAWVKRTQAVAGGWGDGGNAGEPTANATALGLLALVTAGEGASAEAAAAVAWLLDRQQLDGDWGDAVALPLAALTAYRVGPGDGKMGE